MSSTLWYHCFNIAFSFIMKAWVGRVSKPLSTPNTIKSAYRASSGKCKASQPKHKNIQYIVRTYNRKELEWFVGLSVSALAHMLCAVMSGGYSQLYIEGGGIHAVSAMTITVSMTVSWKSTMTKWANRQGYKNTRKRKKQVDRKYKNRSTAPSSQPA